MKLKNNTEKMVSFYSPELGRWWTLLKNEVIDIPDQVAWRGKAHGLVQEGVVKVEKPAEVESKPVKKKMKKQKLNSTRN